MLHNLPADGVTITNDYPLPTDSPTIYSNIKITSHAPTVGSSMVQTAEHRDGWRMEEAKDTSESLKYTKSSPLLSFAVPP